MATSVFQNDATSRRAELWLMAAGVFALTSGALVLRLYPPTSLHLPPCPFHALTGLYCPGCGSTRALHHLLNFEFVTALKCNFLAVAMLPYLLALFGMKAMRRLRVWRGPELELPVNWAWLLTAVVIAWWIVRNLPFAMFVIPAQ
jgi:hypothetical protein